MTNETKKESPEGKLKLLVINETQESHEERVKLLETDGTHEFPEEKPKLSAIKETIIETQELKPKLSVIIPTYNRENTIEKCLDAVFNSYFKDFEIIVVDDCSTDSTLEKLKKYECRVIELKRNRGVANARNVGAKHAKADLLVFVDSDLMVYKNTFSKMLEVYESGQDIKVVGAVESGKCFSPKFSDNFCTLKICYDYKWKKGVKFVDNYSAFNSECGLIEKKVFEEVGGFNTKYKGAGVEEYDTGYEIIRHGYKNYIAPDILCDHVPKPLKNRAIKLFHRTATYVPLFLKKKSFEATGGTGTLFECTMSILSLSILVTLPLLLSSRFFVVPVSLSALYVISNLKFLFWMAKRAGILSFFPTIFASMVLHTSMGLGIIFGFSKLITSQFNDLLNTMIYSTRIFTSRLPYVDLFVTSKCNLKCKHCFYMENLNKPNKELTLEEIQKVSKNLDKIYYLTMTGGEPTIRNDIVEIVKTFYHNNDVKIMGFHSNGLNPKRLKQITEDILDSCPNMAFSVLISLDGFKETHNNIRVSNQSYDNVIESVEALKEFMDRPNFDITLGTTIMDHNKNDILALNDFVKNKLGVKHDISYLRGRPKDTLGKGGILEKYKEFSNKIKNERHPYPSSRLKDFLVSAAKDVVIKVEEEHKSVVPCQAIKKSVVISEEGDIYPCEVLHKNLGNVRDYDYDVNKILAKSESRNLQKWIWDNKCHCTWECIIPLNIITSWKGYMLLFKKSMMALKNKERHTPKISKFLSTT